MTSTLHVAVSARRVPEGDGEALALRYVVTNPFALEVLLFDRDADGDRDWMDVRLEGARARLSRALVSCPAEVLAHEVAPPLARLLAPGASHATEVKLALPLCEAGPWLDLTREPIAPDAPREVSVDALELALGWCVLYDRAALPDEVREPIERDGEVLFALPTELMAPAQQELVVAAGALSLTARVFDGGVA